MSLDALGSRLVRAGAAAGSAVLLLGSFILAKSVLAGESEIFHRPVRLQTAEGPVDTGDAVGHSGPYLADVDGDGLRDLVVGDFSGKFRFYRNIGDAKAPRYAPHTYLEAGGDVAQVPIY